MNNHSSHIITNNHLRITRNYLDEIILPVFGEMAKSVSPIKKTYSIAGKTVCIHFYSKILKEKISKAISHNEEHLTKHPDLTVHIWDSISTNTNIVPPWKNHLRHVYPQETNSKTINTDSFLGVYLPGEKTLNIYDEKNNVAYFWIQDANDLPYWVVAAPLRPILNWFLSKTGTYLIHGAVVGLNGQSVLLTAKSKSGKSTTSLACLLSGMEYIGDDYVAIELDHVIKAHSLFNSVKVFPESLNTFFELKGRRWGEINPNNEGEKVIVFLSELFPKQVIRSSRLNAIMIPVIKNTEKTKIVRASKLQAMLAMIPTTLFQLSMTESNKVAELKSIVEKTPCYFLELGCNPYEVSEAIKSFLSHEK